MKAPANRVVLTLQCNVCGRFVRYQDIAEGRAVHHMLTPSSDRSDETWETLCPKHRDA